MIPTRGRPNGRPVWSSPAVEERTRTNTKGSPTHRRGALSAGKYQLERSVTPSRDVCSRWAQDQPGAESAPSNPECETEANDLSGTPQDNYSGAESAVGE